MAKLWLTEFTVESKGRSTIFPVDMLRHDFCVPASEEESGNMVFNLMGYSGVEATPVRLHHVEHGSKRWTPTSGRWESFGWKVTTIGIAKDIS